MVSINTLRIGNYIRHDRIGVIRVTSILGHPKNNGKGTITGFSLRENLPFALSDESLEPIALTPQLLKNMGFHSNRVGHNDFDLDFTHVKEGFEINQYQQGEDGKVEYGWDTGLGYTADVDQLHILQNLYFFASNGQNIITNEDIFKK